MLKKIKEVASTCPNEEGKLYLLQALSLSTGFFILNGKVMLVIRNVDEKKPETTETEKLILSTKVKIKAAVNAPSFEAGEYNYVLYRGQMNDMDFDNFIRICMIYINDETNISIKQFFYSIIDMFQLPKEQSYKNLLGLYGELFMILFVYQKSQWNIAKGWHTNSTDKYDFSLKGFILEVKTTTSNLLNVQLKHDQLFEKKGVYLGVIYTEESNAGKSLSELLEEINVLPVFAEDFNFQVAIEKEVKRISDKDMQTKKFDVKETLFYLNEDIPTVKEIPENITELSYKCALIGVQTQDINKIKNKFLTNDREEDTNV